MWEIESNNTGTLSNLVFLYLFNFYPQICKTGSCLDHNTNNACHIIDVRVYWSFDIVQYIIPVVTCSIMVNDTYGQDRNRQ